MKQEFNWAMDQVKLPPEAEERILRALEEQKAGKAPRRSRRTWKTAVAAVAAAVLMTGTAFAAAYQAGVLDIFFRGDTSSLESYRTIQSTEDENYRLTVDSLRDGDGLYLYLTVEPKTEQAAQVLPDIEWGPGTFSFTPGMTKGWWESEETTDPEAGRSFSIETNLTMKALETLEPITFSANFMAEDCTLQLPIQQSAPTASRSIDRDIEVNPLTGETEYWTDVTISSTRFSYTSIQNYSKMDGGRGVADPLIFLKMTDGSILTRSQLGLGPAGFEQILDVEGLPEEKRMDRIIEHFQIVIDPTQVESLIVDGMEFPMDGSDPKEVQMDEALLPFYVEAMDYQDTQGNPGSYVSSMEELCEKLGADYSWDPETKTATGVYRGVTLRLTAGSGTAEIDGTPTPIQEYTRSYQAIQNGNTIAVYPCIFETAWQIDLFRDYVRTIDHVDGQPVAETEWLDWIVIP